MPLIFFVRRIEEEDGENKVKEEVFPLFARRFERNIRNTNRFQAKSKLSNENFVVQFV